MRITFVLPAANLGGGNRVIAMYAEHLRRRGHQILVVSTKQEVPHLLDRIKLFIKGYGWWPSDPGPSHFDGLELEHRVINRFRPVTDSDLPDADVGLGQLVDASHAFGGVGSVFAGSWHGDAPGREVLPGDTTGGGIVFTDPARFPCYRLHFWGLSRRLSTDLPGPSSSPRSVLNCSECSVMMDGNAATRLGLPRQAGAHDGGEAVPGGNL